MSSQKQCHRIRKNEDIRAQLIAQNSDLVRENMHLKHANKQYSDALAYHMSRPPIWNIPAYLKWKKELN